MEKYINEVMSYLDLDKKVSLRIKEDLENRIEEAKDHDPFFDPYLSIGSPLQVANEFMESIDDFYPSKKGVVHSSFNRYEYKSKKMLFGIPLIHINTGGRVNPRRAKGIIAIGDVATGVLAVGGVSVGVVSVGGIGMGLVGIGGVAIGAFALGGVGVGLVSFGGVAIGVLKGLGGLALMTISGLIG